MFDAAIFFPGTPNLYAVCSFAGQAHLIGRARETALRFVLLEDLKATDAFDVPPNSSIRIITGDGRVIAAGEIDVVMVHEQDLDSVAYSQRPGVRLINVATESHRQTVPA